MTPRRFIEFFNTRTGRLVGFIALFAGALAVATSFRGLRDAEEPVSSPLPPRATNDAPQTVQTVQRPLEPFRPPVTKPEPKAISLPKLAAEAPARTNAPAVVAPPTPAPTPPITLFADAEAGQPEPKGLSPEFAPYGRLIPCETIITVDSSSIQTPIIGLVTEDIHHAGRLIIPAGTEVHGTAQTDRHRERISSGSSWTLVWRTGEELRLKGIVLDREFSGDQEGWGITDGSAGLRGRLLKSDDLAEIKLFAATVLGGAAGALTEKETTLFGSVDSRSLNNAPLKGAQDTLKLYAQRILEAIQRDGFYVRVASGKQFYLYVLQTIDRAEATLGGATSPPGPDAGPSPSTPPTP